MATKYLTLDNLTEKKQAKETVFTKSLTSELTVKEWKEIPSHYDNVLYLGYDSYYGDVFKAWNNNHTDFTIYFGEKGTEFDNQ